MNAFSGGARRTPVGAAVALSICAPALAQQTTSTAQAPSRPQASSNQQAASSESTSSRAPPAPHAFQQITVTADRVTATAPGEDVARVEAAHVPGGADVV